MTRILGIVAILLLAVALIVLPDVKSDRLAAMDIHKLLDEPIQGDGAGTQSLADFIFEHPSVRREGNQVFLKLGGVRTALVDVDPVPNEQASDETASEAELAEVTEPENSEPEQPVQSSGPPSPDGVSPEALPSVDTVADSELTDAEQDETETTQVATPVNEEEDEFLRLNLVARRSLARGLREAAYSRTGDNGEPLALTIESERAPQGKGGLHFLVRTEGNDRILECQPTDEDTVVVRAAWTPTDWKCLLPPLIAILLAVLFRRPVLALFMGVLSAAWIVRFMEGASAVDSTLAAIAYVPEPITRAEDQVELTGLLARPFMEGIAEKVSAIVPRLPDWLRDFFWPEFADGERAMIIGFVVCMLAMVGIITRAGGIRGLMDSLSKLARGVRSTQFVTWLMGLVVFFDDYANTVLVGSTMRPLTDRFRIAREKLAYIVDSTAAPVAGLSVLSTWIAFEVSTFSSQLPAAGLLPSDGYTIFFQSLPYRFYSILTLFFVGMVVISGRDFGPMLKAERRARWRGLLVSETGKPMVGSDATSMEPVEGITPHAASALYPVGVFIFVTLLEILRSGGAFAVNWIPLFLDGGWLQQATQVLSDGSGAKPILLGSVWGLLVATAIAHSKGMNAWGDILRAAWVTLRSLGGAIAILYLAWMIGRACDELSTANYLTAILGDRIWVECLPIVLFGMSAIVALATGSSWSTMSILLPLVVGLSFAMGEDNPNVTGHFLMVICIGAVLEGAIFGDHCSPISDTTVLSSTASASDHIDHVRTQAPYAIVTVLVAIAVGYLPCVLYPEQWKPLYGLGTGVALIFVILMVFGRRVGDQPDDGYLDGQDDSQGGDSDGIGGFGGSADFEDFEDSQAGLSAN